MSVLRSKFMLRSMLILSRSCCIDLHTARCLRAYWTMFNDRFANTGHSRTDKRLCEVLSVIGLTTFHLSRESRQFFAMLFLFFFGIHFSNSGERAEARAYAVFASDLLLRGDPVAHLRPLSPRTYIARVGSNDIGFILTRISASFGAATRDVSQNGI
jgi:hypothetical protein